MLVTLLLVALGVGVGLFLLLIWGLLVAAKQNTLEDEMAMREYEAEMRRR